MAASDASRRDLKLTPPRVARALNFLKSYERLLSLAGPYEQVLRIVRRRSAVINHEHRMTGDAVINIVQELINARDKVGRDDLQSAMDLFIDSQVLVPDRWRPIDKTHFEGDTPRSRLLRSIQAGLESCKETV
jgi:hypothetical protein